MPVDDRLKQLEVLVEQVQEGERPAEECGAVLRALLKVLELQEERLGQIELPPEARESLEEEFAGALRGITRFREGLQRLLTWTSSSRPADLEAGMALAREGNDLMNATIRQAAENRAELERQEREGTWPEE